MSDPALLIEVASLVDRHAAHLHRDAVQLARITGACEWDGPAARQFRTDASPLLHQMRLVAVRLDDAADLLRRHAS
jgi:hypothetical protein